MISTLSMACYSGLPVNLPKVATGRQTPSQSAALTIASDDTIAMQDVPCAQVGEILKARLNKSPDLLIIINADERVDHGLVVEIMDQARQAGVAKMAIAIKPKESRSEK